MSRPLTRHEEKEVKASVQEGKPPRCPRCGRLMSLTEVAPRREVSYVRHRVIAQCGGCDARVVVDRR